MNTKLDVSLTRMTSIEIAARLYKAMSELAFLEKLLSTVNYENHYQLQKAVDALEDYRCAILGKSK